MFYGNIYIYTFFVASQDSTGKMVNASGGDWQEETYQKVYWLALFFTYINITNMKYPM